MSSDILDKILAVKREEVAAASAAKPLAAIRAEAEAHPKPRDFVGAIRNKIGAKVGAGGTAAPEVHDTMSDILNALLALGYNEREALGAMKALPADASVSDGIRLALKSLAKG